MTAPAGSAPATVEQPRTGQEGRHAGERAPDTDTRGGSTGGATGAGDPPLPQSVVRPAHEGSELGGGVPRERTSDTPRAPGVYICRCSYPLGPHTVACLNGNPGVNPPPTRGCSHSVVTSYGKGGGVRCEGCGVEFPAEGRTAARAGQSPFPPFETTLEVRLASGETHLLDARIGDGAYPGRYVEAQLFLPGRGHLVDVRALLVPSPATRTRDLGNSGFVRRAFAATLRAIAAQFDGEVTE